MKKIILILGLLLAPLTVFAANYKISNFYVDAKLLDNGDMQVAELIVLEGTFNGYERDLIYKNNNTNNLYNATDITNIEVYSKNINSSVNWQIFKEKFSKFSRVNKAKEGDRQKFIETAIPGGTSLKMFYRTSNSKTAFLIKYIVKNVGIVHKDCIELYWNFIGNDFSDDLNDVKIRFNMPEVLDKEDFNWWFHGDLIGNSLSKNEDDYTYILAEVSKIKAYNPVDFRILLPLDLYKSSTFLKMDNEEVKENIIKEEDKRVKDDLEEIAKIKKIYDTSRSVTWTYYGILLVVGFYVFMRFDKERKVKFKHYYNRDFIDEYNVEVIDYLMNKNITPNAMSASIMNLIYKKNISYEIVNNTKKANYKFTLQNRDNLSEAENILVNFLFQKVGDNDVFTTDELKKYAKGVRTSTNFMSSFNGWKNQVLNDAKKENFFENNTKAISWGIIMFIISIIIYIILLSLNVIYVPLMIMPFFSISFLLYTIFMSKKTERGIEHYARWKSFKNFLNDFGTFDVKELPEIELWERYLVYATVFGLAKRVEKSMNVRIKEINPNMVYTDFYFSPHIHLAYSLNSAISSAYQGAQTTINRQNANASGGSYGGHGGGFSSGGGFGGGGGGGRGF